MYNTVILVVVIVNNNVVSTLVECISMSVYIKTI